MTFETSQLQSLNIISGNKTKNEITELPGQNRHTLVIKTNATEIFAKWVSLLNSEDTN